VFSPVSISTARGGAKPSPGCAETLEALLNANSDVNCVDYWQRSALLYAGCNQEDPKCLEHLVRAGADLNVQDCRERTPLGYAARMGKNRVATYLLSQGADPNISDHWGLSPLFEAIEHNSHDIIRCLLQCGASLAAETHDGRTILQQAAIHGDIPTLRILADHDVRDIGLSAVDRDGLIAQALFSKRGDVEVALKNAFHALFEVFIRCSGAAAMRGVVCGSVIDDADDDGEEFFDAIEQPDPETVE
jgi:hypothetical protein